MRVLLLLVLLALGGGYVLYQRQHNYPLNTVTTPAGAKYEVRQLPDECIQSTCIKRVVYLSQLRDSASLVAESKGLLPWIDANVPQGSGPQGLMLVALEPGFLRDRPAQTHGRPCLRKNARFKLALPGAGRPDQQARPNVRVGQYEAQVVYPLLRLSASLVAAIASQTQSAPKMYAMTLGMTRKSPAQPYQYDRHRSVDRPSGAGHHGPERDHCPAAAFPPAPLMNDRVFIRTLAGQGRGKHPLETLGLPEACPARSPRFARYPSGTDPPSGAPGRDSRSIRPARSSPAGSMR